MTPAYGVGTRPSPARNRVSATMDTMPRHRQTSDRPSPGDARGERRPLRSTVFEAMHELLGSRDWSAVTMSDVAKAAGISRQTIYNEFGSRHGLAQAYALRLADRLVDQIDDAIVGMVGLSGIPFTNVFNACATAASAIGTV